MVVTEETRVEEQELAQAAQVSDPVSEPDAVAEEPQEDPNLGLSDDEYDSALLRALNNLNEDNLEREFEIGDFAFTMRQMPFTKQMLVSLNTRDNKAVKVLFGFESYDELTKSLSESNPVLAYQALEILQSLALLRHVTKSIRLRRTGQSLGKIGLLELLKKNALLPQDLLTLTNMYDEWGNSFKIKIAEAKN